MEITTPTLEIVVAEQAKEQQLSTSTAEELMTTFRPFFDEGYALLAQSKKINVTSAEQVDEITRSRELRLLLAQVRIGSDKLRKKLKEDSNRRGNAIQGVYNFLKFAVEPEEERLLEQEKFAERRQQERRDALRKEREAALAPMGVDPSPYNLELLEAEDWEQLLENLTARHEAKIEAEQKAEADRLAKMEAERLEQERIRAENEKLRLQNQQIEREKKQAEEQAKAERIELERQQREERELSAQKAREAAAVAKREQNRLEAEKQATITKAQQEAAREAQRTRDELRKEQSRLVAERLESERQANLKLEAERQKAAAEKLAAEKLAAAEKAKADKAAREAREAQQKAEAELQATRDAEAAKIAFQEEEKRKAEAQPDRERLIDFSWTVHNLTVPSMKTESAIKLAKVIEDQLEKFAAEIKGYAEGL